jgi:tetratricopeptide (TPR) repeat protein
VHLPQGYERPAPRRTKTAPLALPVPQSDKGRACSEALANGLDEAEAYVADWVATAKDAELVGAQACRGMIASRQSDWAAAESAFIAARDAAGTDRLARTRYGAMAGNAALAGGEPGRALAALAQAQEDAAGLGEDAPLGEIALDKGRALVALKRAYEARIALDEAMAKAPGNSDAWLLSATLYRRVGDLEKAQRHIERAAELNPVDPAVGLEAGVIAMLGGREAAARKSWTSVVAAAPDSPQAITAKGYLAQLSPVPSTTK